MDGPISQSKLEIIDLSSDRDSPPPDEDAAPLNTQCSANLASDLPDTIQFQRGDVIDLTTISDIDFPRPDRSSVQDESRQFKSAAENLTDGKLVTEAACLQMVLSVLPHISVDYVLSVIHEKTTDATRSVVRCEQLVNELVENGFPKEGADASKKRKRDDGSDMTAYESGQRDPNINDYEREAIELLKDEFLSVPVRHLTNVLREQTTVYKAYIILEKQVQCYQQVATPWAKIGKPRNKRDAELTLIGKGSQLPKELHAARMKIEGDEAKRRRSEEARQAEEANLQQALLNDLMGECACCFDDVPLNRMVCCDGDPVHYYCSDCPRKQIETQMGQSRCRPRCFGVDDCSGKFSRSQLQQVLDEKTFDRLEHMQQMEELKAAGLDFLSDCPFCDFKMECPSVEVDREFRCQNTKCGKTSCRLCEKESHIPLTCQEAKKDGQITLRHIVEEAMSNALIRKCNQCKHPFVKDMGCNKMRCTHCGNLQCYVCSQTVRGYEHFGEGQRGKCPLHDNVEDRHEQEVKQAAEEAMAKVRLDHPELSDADLMTKVSDRVKQAEDVRRGRAAEVAGAFRYQMQGYQLWQMPRNMQQFAIDDQGREQFVAPHGHDGRPYIAPQQQQQVVPLLPPEHAHGHFFAPPQPHVFSTPPPVAIANRNDGLGIPAMQQPPPVPRPGFFQATMNFPMGGFGMPDAQVAIQADMLPNAPMLQQGQGQPGEPLHHGHGGHGIGAGAHGEIEQQIRRARLQARQQALEQRIQQGQRRAQQRSRQAEQGVLPHGKGRNA